MTFSDLGLSEDLLRAIADAGYNEPTPIQAQAIPYVLMGRDICGCAQTGTGKTASFTLPMIDILASGRGKARMPRSLILEPTRELAAQVAESFDTYGKYHKLNKALLIGGENLGDQAKVLNRGVDVLIATPGRLIDMFERGYLLLNDVKVFVIDESDRMLDMGFIPDVERIAAMLPPLRTTLLFSATMPPAIRKLAEKFLRNPKEISVSPPSSTAATITQGLIMLGKPKTKAPGTDQKMKREALRDLIRKEEPRNALIFCNRKRDVDIVQRSLCRHGIEAARLHGDMAQPVRMETLAKFKNGEVKYLVCSDVAARGLDVPSMSHVFNFDVPTHAEDYVHRIGRTGRAGREGRAFTIAMPADGKYLRAIEELIGKPIPKIDAPASSDAGADLDDGEDEAPKRSRRGRGRERGEKRAEAPKADAPAKEAQSESKAEPKAETKSEPKREPKPEPKSEPKSEARPERKPEPRRDGNRDNNKDDKPVKGLGDHVPAFLMRG
jgi:superfamily II DNA/RNA helicase